MTDVGQDLVADKRKHSGGEMSLGEALTRTEPLKSGKERLKKRKVTKA